MYGINWLGTVAPRKMNSFIFGEWHEAFSKFACLFCSLEANVFSLSAERCHRTGNGWLMNVIFLKEVDGSPGYNLFCIAQQDRDSDWISSHWHNGLSCHLTTEFQLGISKIFCNLSERLNGCHLKNSCELNSECLKKSKACSQDWNCWTGDDVRLYFCWLNDWWSFPER